MKKIFFALLIYLLIFNNVFALNWEKELNQASENTSLLLNFFSIETLINIVFAMIAIVFTLVISKIINSKIGAFIEKSWSWENREELAWVMTRTVNISILAIGFTIALAILWVDVTIFLWGLWFGLWFTLKIFLSNFVAWIVMVTQWSYHNWDLIRIWDKIWNITKINSLFTEVEQFDGVIFFIPNIKFLENEVENFNQNDKRRVEINIWVDYDTDIVKAKKIMLKIVNNFPLILKSPDPSIFVTNFSDSSIDLSLRFWINSSWEYFQIKSNVTETINLAFKEYGIKIPYPQLTLSTRDNSNINLEQIKN